MDNIVAPAILLAVVAAYGYLMPRRVSQHYYTVVNLCFGFSAVLIAGLCGASWENLGLGANRLGGILATILILTAFISASVIVRYRRLAPMLGDYKQLLVRIPFGTAYAEELVFRSSMMGVLLHSYSRLTAVIVSSIAFGFWHLLPGPISSWAYRNLPNNPVRPRFMKTLSASLTVAATSAGGLVFAWLRLFGGGIILPWALHTLTNTTGWLITKDTISGRLIEPVNRGRLNRKAA